MGLEGVKVGDEVFHVESRWGRTTTAVVAITDIGRRSITTTGCDWSPYKFHKKTGYGTAKTPGRIYRSESEYVEEQRRRRAWVDTHRAISSMTTYQDALSLDTIQQVRALLGLPAWEG
jgi:hypothetical protein